MIADDRAGDRPSPWSRRTPRTWVAVLTLLVVAAGLVGVPSPALADHTQLSLRPASSGWGVNGTVYAVKVVGDRVFVGGDFTRAVGPDGATLPRGNLAAFSTSSGRPIAGWVANTSGPVFALAASSTALWVGGAFATIGASARSNLAKVSLASGAVDPAFLLDTSGAVRAIARTGSRLYVGGDFVSAADERHGHVVAASAATGAVDESFLASTNGTVRSLAPARGRLYIGGRFRTVSGGARAGLGVVDAGSGALTGPSFRFSSSAPARARVIVLSLQVSQDGRVVFGGVGGKPRYGVGNKVAAWSTATGRPRWEVRLGGDGQAVRLWHGTVYVGFHHGYEGDTRLRLLAIRAGSGRVSRTFEPTFRGFWGVRSIDASARGIAVGGSFTRVQATPRSRLALFPFVKARGRTAS